MKIKIKQQQQFMLKKEFFYNTINVTIYFYDTTCTFTSTKEYEMETTSPHIYLTQAAITAVVLLAFYSFCLSFLFALFVMSFNMECFSSFTLSHCCSFQVLALRFAQFPSDSSGEVDGGVLNMAKY